MLLVKKYGGSSVSTPEQIGLIADQIAHCKASGHSILVVVSAMGKTTDQLVALAQQVSQAPSRRELDMLLTTGERVTMALLCMALQDRGVPSISLTGSQAGILTDSTHSNARIIDVKPVRVREELERGRVVVLAGFQGVNPQTKEITTLGRGGSDTTAVAMAAHFHAERCEILKDVEGVYTADPRFVPDARHLPQLGYQHLLEMTFWGAKVLHYRSVELAAKMNVPLLIALAHGQGQQTLIGQEESMFENEQILAVNRHESVDVLRLGGDNVAEALERFDQFLAEHHLPWPQILFAQSKASVSLTITGPEETLAPIRTLGQQHGLVTEVDRGFATVTVTCHGAPSSELPMRILQTLKENGVNVAELMASSTSLTARVAREQSERALQCLHRLISCDQ